jgi:hypothetical protein
MLHQKINLASIVRWIHVNPNTGPSQNASIARAPRVVSPCQLKR